MVKTKVIAVANPKGGGITTAFILGADLAANGTKVLLVDADPQGDLTKMLGMSKPNDLPLTLGDVMAISHRMPASVSVQKHCSIQGVFQYMKHILGRKGNIY